MTKPHQYATITPRPPKRPQPTSWQTCTARVEGDEMVCRCGLRWERGEDRPACPEKRL